MALREVDQRLGLAERLAACIEDPRLTGRVRHRVANILRFRLLMIAAGYEDGNDADHLRHDPVFKLALGSLPGAAALCSQPAISRLENLPDIRCLLRMGRAMVEVYCNSFCQVPRRIVLDIDDTFDAVHGGQQLRLFNAYHDEYGFQPIVVFDGEGRIVAALLRPAKRPSGHEVRAFLRRLVRAIRSHWPQVRILLRGDSHYCSPEVLDFCRAEGLDFLLGVAPTSTLRRHIEALEQRTAARFAVVPGNDKLRRYKEFYDGAASWSRVERIIARVEVSTEGPDTRFIVTNLSGRSARALYERGYCKRGMAENHIIELEIAPRRRPDLLPPGGRQSVPLVPAHRCLLAALVTASPDAEAFVLAHRPVRYPTLAANQARRPRRRAQNPDHAPPADRQSDSGSPTPCARTAAQACHMSAGAACPILSSPPQPPAPQSHPPAAPNPRLAKRVRATIARVPSRCRQTPPQLREFFRLQRDEFRSDHIRPGQSSFGILLR